jgi:serine/threonine protein kinase
MIGQTVSHYRILEKLGAGGMGVVYKAEDITLKRLAALKFLPPELTKDAGAKQRFLHEARAAAVLNHANIVTVYEINEHDERTYIAMEYVEGQTLKKLISADPSPITHHPLPIPQVIDIATQIASGLAAAHEKGIVHRDIKPANIFITKNNVVKVLDFGIAKLAGSQTRLTKTGSTMGTVAYMSPEQAQGKEVDQRSDIWSLGIILYEMLAGKTPFQGEYMQGVVYSILNEQPKPLEKVRPDMPAGLELVVGRALAKDPKDRYQSMNDLAANLKAATEGTQPIAARTRGFAANLFSRKSLYLSAAAAALAVLLAFNIGGIRDRFFGSKIGSPRTIRLAVLPFANLSSDPEQEYFSDGLTQEMIVQLGKLHPKSLSVIARTSVMRFKKSDIPIDHIGHELNVEYVIEGSVQREADRVRITAELIKVQDQAQLWADSFERDLSGILTLQTELANKVAGALALKLLPAEQEQLTNARSVNPEAYEAYLKGSFHWKKLIPAELDIAQRYFEMALEKDPAYAPAYEGLAWVWSTRQQVGAISPREAGPKAKAAALQAIALDDRSAEAHEALAMVKTWTDWDWASAEREWRKALELNPNAANAHAHYAHFLAIMGRSGEALLHSERALKLDPFNTLYQGMYAQVLLFQRRYDDALAAANAAQALQPDAPLASNCIQSVQIIKGMRNELLAIQRKRIAGDPERVAAFEQGLAEGGYAGAQRRIADLLVARYEKSGGVPDASANRIYLPCGIALRYFDAGDYDRAIDWFEKAYEERDPNLPYMGNPLYDPLRSYPRFQSLLKRIGLPSGEKR